MEALVNRSSRGKYTVMPLLALAAFLFGVAGIVRGIRLGWLVAPFFALVALVFVWHIVDTRARLILDAEGVVDRKLRSAGKIARVDVEAAYAIRTTPWSDYIGLRLRDAEAYRGRLPRAGRALLTGSRRTGFPDRTLNPVRQAARTDDVFATVARHCERAAADSARSVPTGQNPGVS